MPKTVFWYNQRILFKTYLPAGGWAKGREYYWMQDTEGTQYLAKIDANGNPDLS